MIAISVSIVCATVLLSNDMRHLRSLMARLGHKLPTTMAPQSRPRQARVIPASVKILPWLFATPEGAQAGFMRSWKPRGDGFCNTMREAGIEVSDWEGAELGDAGTYECSYERAWSDGSERRSIFYLVRGNSAGAISTVRVKLVNPETTMDGDLSPELLESLSVVAGAAGWRDLTTGASDAIRQMKDVKLAAFGAELSFQREPTSKASFNFILSILPAGDEETRTAAFFDTEKWLPYNPEFFSGSQSFSYGTAP